MNHPNTDIPLEHALILWNPGYSGKIAVVRHMLQDAPELARSTGACWASWQEGDGNYRRYKLLLELWHIVVRDGLNPGIVHNAMQVIPEYREMFDGDEVSWLNEAYTSRGRSGYLSG